MTKEEKKANVAGSSSATVPDWMNFPTLVEVFRASPSETIAHLAARRNEYEAQSTTGKAADRVRNRLIYQSYARTSELLQELEERRQEILKKDATEVRKSR